VRKQVSRVVTISTQTRHTSPGSFGSSERGGDVNAVTLIGNLCTDVELKEVGEGKRVASFLLAVDRPGKSSEADFFYVSVWERQAELCAQYLSKGQQVAVEGRLRSRSWHDADGKKRRAVEVVARSVQFLSRPPETAEEAPFETAAA
jgi:single-strand DNA-binding protein